MDIQKQVRAAQLAILTKYNLLADCSGLDESALKRIIKGMSAPGDKDDPTFASWCDQVLGKGVRLPIARFDYDIPGQTKISSLADGYELAQGVLDGKKEYQASLKAYRQAIRQLEADRAVESPAVANSVLPDAFSRSLRDWYGRAVVPLRTILWEIKEVEGEFFNHQGAANRDYRACLIDAILPALRDLEGLGFNVDVQLHEVSRPNSVPQHIVIFDSRFPAFDGYSHDSFTFVVENVQPDLLEIADQYSGPARLNMPVNEVGTKFNCHVSVSAENVPHCNDDERFHLSCFLQKIFSALAKSSDSVARGILREKVLLCLLLSWTAPCMPAREQMKNILLSDIFHKLSKPTQAARLNTTPDIPAGQIADHLFFLLEEHFRS
jgi:hypothetical protein